MVCDVVEVDVSAVVRSRVGVIERTHIRSDLDRTLVTRDRDLVVVRIYATVPVSGGWHGDHGHREKSCGGQSDRTLDRRYSLPDVPCKGGCGRHSSHSNERESVVEVGSFA